MKPEDLKNKTVGKEIESISWKSVVLGIIKEHDSFEEAFKRMYIDSKKRGVIQYSTVYLESPEKKRISYPICIDRVKDTDLIESSEKNLALEIAEEARKKSEDFNK